jgi:hypothetical protein
LSTRRAAWSPVWSLCAEKREHSREKALTNRGES